MSLSKIAVGVDLSPDSLRAVEHAMVLARRAGASLTMIHIAGVPSAISEASGDPWAALMRERLAADRAQLDEVRQRFAGQGVELSQVIVEGTPDTALAEAARELHADLVVIGTHGRTGLKRLVLGSVTEKTVRLAASSVLVVRGEVPAGGYRRVIVGTDYSDQAWRALAQAFEVAAPEANVRVIYAWQIPYVGYDVGGYLTNALWEREETIAAEHRKRVLEMAPAGVQARLDVVVGVPFTMLDEPPSDLVVVGTHGRRGARRFFLGSVAEATVRHARSSVLVVR